MKTNTLGEDYLRRRLRNQEVDVTAGAVAAGGAKWLGTSLQLNRGALNLLTSSIPLSS